MMKRLVFAFVVALLSFTSLTRLSTAQSAKACPTNTDPILFGAAVSLTGTYSHEGLDTQRGYNVWADWVNSEYGGIKVGDKAHCVQIKFYDDQSKTDIVSTLTEKLISEDNVRFILGPYASDLTASASVITERHNIIMIEANGAAESLFSRGFKYLFGVLTPGSYYTKAALESVYKLGARSVVIAYEDTAFPTSVARGAKQWAEGLGMKVLGFEPYPAGVTDLTAMFTKFRDLKPDIFVGGGHYNDAVLFLKTAKALNFSPAAFILTVGPSSPQYAKDIGADAEGVWGATQWESSMTYKDAYFGTSADYAARFLKKYPDAAGVSYQSAESTAAALVLQLAIEKAGSIDSTTVRDVLVQTDMMTFYGPIKFDDTGKNVGKPMGAIQIQNGKNILVSPDSIAVGKPIYPAVPWDKRSN